MDDGEFDLSILDFSSSELGKEDQQLPCSGSMDSLFDDILNDTHECTHVHTCNPGGPDFSHTHSCFHVHTKVLPGPSEDKEPTDDKPQSEETKSKKRLLGNRAAVRKYREQKKAWAASLADEVVRLTSMNQQLLKRLQGEAVLEAEIARLKCLLVDIKGRIEGEIGSFPYQKSATAGDGMQNLATNPNFSSAYMMNPCDLSCDEQVYCLHNKMQPPAS